MRLTWIATGSARLPRLAVLVLAAAFVLGAASICTAQDAAAQGAAAQEKPTLAFQNDAGLIIFYVKPDKTADFEDMMNKLKEGLAKMEAPEARQMLAGMKLFKTPVAEGAQVATYVLFADPIVKNTEYWLLSLLYKAYPAEAQALYQKWQDLKAANPAQPSILDLTQVIKFQ
jgi:hypothetical protein